MKFKRVVAALSAAVFHLAVQAQTVYRCGPDGRTYSQSPCAQGTSVDVGDSRSHDQRASAQAVARDTRARGENMERDRIKYEKSIHPMAAGTIGQPVELASASNDKPAPKKKKNHAKPRPEVFRAVSPASKTKEG